MANQNDEKTNVQDGAWTSNQGNSQFSDVFDDMQSAEPEILDADMQVTPEVFDSARNDLHLAVVFAYLRR